MRIVKIVSGGQTGADRGGLEAALEVGVPHGGWCPKGRKAEDGPIPARFLLQETASADYLVRTEENVKCSTATLIFTQGRLEGGSKRTADFAHKHHKPCLHVDLGAQPAPTPAEIMTWLRFKCPGDVSLNIAGSRGSKAPALEAAVRAFVVAMLRE